jgi:hypothetical protein
MGERSAMRRGDWVTTQHGGRGFVLRVSGGNHPSMAWADVRWKFGAREWSKRMRQSDLIVTDTIEIAGGYTVTDITPPRVRRGR